MVANWEGTWDVRTRFAYRREMYYLGIIAVEQLPRICALMSRLIWVELWRRIHDAWCTLLFEGSQAPCLVYRNSGDGRCMKSAMKKAYHPSLEAREYESSSNVASLFTS